MVRREERGPNLHEMILEDIGVLEISAEDI
jgi:hypothetical protein